MWNLINNPDSNSQLMAALGILSGFMLNLVTLITAIHLIYRKFNGCKSILFTLYIFNIIMFMISASFEDTSITIGGGIIGLLAILSMMRYRSELVSMKDMTYLLIAVSIGIINARFRINEYSIFFAILDACLVGCVFFLEAFVLGKIPKVQKFKYKNIKNLTEDYKRSLILEIENKTGWRVLKLSIESVNLNKNNAVICIQYVEKDKTNFKQPKIPEKLGLLLNPWNQTKELTTKRMEDPELVYSD